MIGDRLLDFSVSGERGRKKGQKEKDREIEREHVEKYHAKNTQCVQNAKIQKDIQLHMYM